MQTSPPDLMRWIMKIEESAACKNIFALLFVITELSRGISK